MYLIIKRIFDIIFSLFMLPLILVIVLFVGIVIKIEDGGSVFYLANRIGRRGKIFKMFKFRSMKVNAHDIRLADGSTYNSANDERVTKVGKFLRKTSIDEIPQVLNILKGDMSFIGPRPDSAMWLEHYTEEEKVILTVRPGISGYNQVISRNAVGTKEKLQNDIIYINKISFAFDVKIFLMTIKIVVHSKNIYRDDTSVVNADLKNDVIRRKTPSV